MFRRSVLIPVAVVTITAGCGGSGTSSAKTSAAANITCKGVEASPGVLDHQTVNGNVTVPAGQTCWITFSTVNGNVQAQQGAGLKLWGSTVAGNVQTNNAAWVNLGVGNTINGNLKVSGTTGTTPASATAPDHSVANDLCNSVVGGNVQVQASGAGAPFDIGANPDCGASLTIIRGNLQVNDNAGRVDIGDAGPAHHSNDVQRGNIGVRGNTGGGTLSGNRAGGNCTLQGNHPGIVGTHNTAGSARTNTCNRTT